MSQAYITVDGTLSESVTEYAAILDFHNEGLQLVEKFQSFEVQQETEEDEYIVYNEQLYEEVSNSAKYLIAIPDKEFESSANLASYILSFSNNFNSLVVSFLTSLVKELQFDDISAKVVRNKKRSLKLTATIAVLSNTFNLTDLVNESTKTTIFNSILDLVNVLDDIPILLPYVDQIEASLISKESTEETRSSIIKFAKLIKPVDELKSLKLYELAVSKISSPSQSLIEEYLTENLNSKQTIDLSSIIKQTTVEIPSPYSTLIREYLSLPAPEFQSKLQSYSSLPSLDLIQISRKNQFLNLAKLGLQTPKVTYVELSSKLNIKEQEVENFIIDAIKAKVLQGKLSQVDSSLSIYKVLIIAEEINAQDWKEIKEILLDWRAKLKEVKGLVEQAQKKKVKA